MSTEKTSKFDALKWLVVLLVLGGGLAANYFYMQEPVPLKMAAWILLIVVMLLVASRTMKGRKIGRFIREARNEIRRVVWPTRHETVQMTLIVFVMVFVLALILWGIDSSLMALMGWFTGLGS
jgi:preprotein translocase subunit SecE